MPLTAFSVRGDPAFLFRRGPCLSPQHPTPRALRSRPAWVPAQGAAGGGSDTRVGSGEPGSGLTGEERAAGQVARVEGGAGGTTRPQTRCRLRAAQDLRFLPASGGNHGGRDATGSGRGRCAEAARPVSLHLCPSLSPSALNFSLFYPILKGGGTPLEALDMSHRHQAPLITLMANEYFEEFEFKVWATSIFES